MPTEPPKNAPLNLSAGRPVPARTIPVPRTVSPAMQEWIAHPLPALVEAVPQTAAEWRAAVELHVEARRELLGAVRAMCPVRLEHVTVGGVKCHLVTPDGGPLANSKSLLLHLHGGAYVFGRGEIGAIEAVLLAHHGRVRVLSVDYRMPPDHPFPAALDNALAVYRALLAEHRPAELGVFGTSAGAGLAAALLHAPGPRVSQCRPRWAWARPGST